MDPVTDHLIVLQSILKTIAKVPQDEDLRSLHNDFRKLIADMEDIRQRQQTKLAQLDKGLTEWSKSNSIRLDGIQVLINQRVEQAKIVESQRASLIDLQAQSQALEAQIKDLKQLKAKTLVDLDKIKQGGADLLEDFKARALLSSKGIEQESDKDNQIHELHQKLIALKASSKNSVGKLEDELKTKDHRVQELEQKLTYLQTSSTNNANKLKDEIRQKDDQARELEQQLRKKQQGKNTQIAGLRQQLVDSPPLSNTNSLLPEEDLGSKNPEVKKLQQELHSLRASAENAITKWQEKVKSKKAHVTTLDKQIAAFFKIQDTLHNDADRKNEELRRCKADLKESQLRVKELEKVIADKDNSELEKTSDLEQELIATDTRTNTLVDVPLTHESRARKRKAYELEESEEESEEGSLPSTNRHSPEMKVRGKGRIEMLPIKWPINEVQKEDFSPHPLPPTVLERIRKNMESWKKTSSWTKPTKHRRCLQTITQRKKSVWSNGVNYRCELCSKRGYLCVVVETEGVMTLLPAVESQQDTGLGIEDEPYWFGRR